MKKHIEFLGKEKVKEVTEITSINTNLLFEVKFLGCTNTLGDRIKIKNILTNEAVVLDYDYNGHYNTTVQAALYIEACGYKVIGTCENYIITEFDTSKNLMF